MAKLRAFLHSALPRAAIIFLFHYLVFAVPLSDGSPSSFIENNRAPSVDAAQSVPGDKSAKEPGMNSKQKVKGDLREQSEGNAKTMNAEVHVNDANVEGAGIDVAGSHDAEEKDAPSVHDAEDVPSRESVVSFLQNRSLSSSLEHSTNFASASDDDELVVDDVVNSSLATSFEGGPVKRHASPGKYFPCRRCKDYERVVCKSNPCSWAQGTCKRYPEARCL